MKVIFGNTWEIVENRDFVNIESVAENVNNKKIWSLDFERW
jgi:hypothetical protein